MPEEDPAPEVIIPEEAEPGAIMPEELEPDDIMPPDAGAMADEEAIGEDIIGEDEVIIGEDAIIDEEVIDDDIDDDDDEALEPVEDPHATRVRASAPTAANPTIFLVNKMKLRPKGRSPGKGL